MALTDDDLDQISEMISEQSLDKSNSGITEFDIERILRKQEEYIIGAFENLEATVKDLTRKFEDLETETTESIQDLRYDLDGKLADLEDTTAELKQQIAVLRDQNDSLQDQVEELETELNRLRNI